MWLGVCTRNCHAMCDRSSLQGRSYHAIRAFLQQASAKDQADKEDKALEAEPSPPSLSDTVVSS
eukprot:m.75669 g.75669  ORF g.75669 m.75669 type:complete len:64 (-) comp12455_c0_seq1:58-249(-)